LECGWADKCVPSIGLIEIASSDNEWHERDLLVAHRSWVLQNSIIALGWTPKFEGRVVVGTAVLTVQATLVVRQPKSGYAADVSIVWGEERLGTGEKPKGDYVGSR